MALSNMKVFNEYLKRTTIETLAQDVEKFNASSAGAIRLTTQGIDGDFLQESFWAGLHGAQRRVDRYAANGNQASTPLCTTEDGRTLTFIAMAMDLALPKNDNSAFQNLVLGLDNVTGEVQEVVEEAKAADERFIITFRRYLAEDLTFPQERYRMTLLSREYEDDVAKLTAGFFDLLNTNGLRTVLTTTLAPGLKYL
ncbi:major capsid protein [Pseudomonas sp. Leaf58]|uniref:major capsid protein n=1 Tax=Pseudomonas sp. Leaf58 TaxID=1736226 RepID=UPI0009EB69EA|nr:major capsid protein [Pseudomonas sp. Leaf58]